MKPCDYCKKVFAPKMDTQRFCSRKCRQKFTYYLQGTERQCAACGKPFRTNYRRNGAYCSRLCFGKRVAELKKGWPVQSDYA